MFESPLFSHAFHVPLAAERKYFSRLNQVIKLPNLIEVQKDSYKWLFEKGLKDLFDEISPITDFIGRDLELWFTDFYLDEPKFDEETAKARNVTYESALRVRTRLVNKKTNEIKEQEVYLGDFPLMTDRGTFVINGIERVVISQLIRSAGVFFTSELIRGRTYYGAKIIPNRGAWLELETDTNGVIAAKIDRKRKVPVTSLLRTFGLVTDDEIIDAFSSVDINPEIRYIQMTLDRDPSKNEEDAVREVYKRVRPGDLASMDNARSFLHNMFFNFDRYDLDSVGRYKLNQRFGFNIPNTPETRILRKEDLVAIISEIIRLNNNQESADDIDHLGNRRVRAVGESVKNRLRIGLTRMERIVKDRMSTLDVQSVTPNQLVNARPVIAALKEFFMSSQLSQFMEQTNPLSELEHKRRLSATGPGGLSRERAGFEVRDVHRTHYGRICPIQTPEGPSIGLINHLSTYARVNEYGFIETPYRKVEKHTLNDGKSAVGKRAGANLFDAKGNKVVSRGEVIDASHAKILSSTKLEKIPLLPRITDEVEYLDAIRNDKVVTVDASVAVDKEGYLIEEIVAARAFGKPELVAAERIDYADVSPKQIVSIATSLIPFLEHDDATRALMGTNMQRQAVSLVQPHAPIVGTGVERRAAYDSGHVVIAQDDGEVTRVTGKEIQVKSKKELRTYPLSKFHRSNAATCINQKPIVEVGQKVNKGDILADGPSIDHGELALGQNVVVAYMTWEGGNYEDAILISDRLVKEDKFTSIYIEDYIIDVRDTKLGPEQITRDIPNVGEEKLRHLDDEGIIRIGAEVFSGDILVGKITPKGETELSAEEKLLRAIFGEKAKDVRDTSLYLEHGEHGKVIDVKTFTRDNGDKLPAGVIKSIQVSVAQLRKIQVGDKMAGRHGNKGVVSRVVAQEDMPFLRDGTPVDIILNPLGVVSRMNLGQLLEAHLGLAAGILGYRVASPVLDGVPLETIREQLKEAGLPEDGKLVLYDGRTGLPFDRKVVVGVAYMLKLNHMVEDKIHQRSIGPYSLVTQQPLGGRAQSGGQRFGEMEVWALEAYGAAHTLQEILTIKSDDVPGRSKAYESIIKGEPIVHLNIPESFNVLVREMKGLALDVELLKDGKGITIPGTKGHTTPQNSTHQQ